jgi:uncharacterized membrane protein YcaP (DUF421 family)
MIIILLRSFILYLTVIFSVRLMGKRQLGELQPSELVITILISNIATLPLENIDMPLTMGLLPILTLVCYEVIMSWLTLKSRKIRTLVSGQPKIIIQNGKIDQKMLKDLRLSVDDLLAGLRTSNIFDISEVQYAVVETDGSISVLQKNEYCPATKKDVGKTDASINPPQVIVSDGNLVYDNLEFIGKNTAWVEAVCIGHNTALEDIFLLTSDKNGSFNLVLNDKN